MEAIKPGKQVAVGTQRTRSSLEIKGLLGSGMSEFRLNFEALEKVHRLVRSMMNSS
jgi:hypothetical protein